MFQPDKLADLIGVTEVKPYTLAHLAAWLETMPTEGLYCYTNTGRCLFAKYAVSLGLGDPKETGEHFGWTAQNQLWDNWNKAHGTDYNVCNLPHDIAAPAPWTFGAALSRTRAAMGAA